MASGRLRSLDSATFTPHEYAHCMYRAASHGILKLSPAHGRRAELLVDCRLRLVEPVGSPTLSGFNLRRERIALHLHCSKKSCPTFPTQLRIMANLQSLAPEILQQIGLAIVDRHDGSPGYNYVTGSTCHRTLAQVIYAELACLARSCRKLHDIFQPLLYIFAASVRDPRVLMLAYATCPVLCIQ